MWDDGRRPDGLLAWLFRNGQRLGELGGSDVEGVEASMTVFELLRRADGSDALWSLAPDKTVSHDHATASALVFTALDVGHLNGGTIAAALEQLKQLMTVRPELDLSEYAAALDAGWWPDG